MIQVCYINNSHRPSSFAEPYHKGRRHQGTLDYHLVIHDYQNDFIVRLMANPLSNVNNLLTVKGHYYAIPSN